MAKTKRRTLIGRFSRTAWLIALGLSLLCLSIAASAAIEDADSVTLDFNDVDIRVFIKFIGELSGQNFIVDPRVRANITLFSPGRISVAEAVQVLDAVLEVHGFTVVPSGRYQKIVPRAQARAQAVETLTAGSAHRIEDRLVTRIVPLQYADPDAVKALLAPLVSKTSVISADDRSGSLIITDTASNIQRLLTLIHEVDRIDAGRKIAVIPLHHAAAADVVTALNAIHAGASPKPSAGSDAPAIFMADERTNTLIMVVDPAKFAGVKGLIEQMDRERRPESARSRVYPLQHADAEETAEILQEFPRMQMSHPGSQATLALLNDQVRVHADKATNSLIVHGPPDAFDILEDVIGRLDIPRAMAYIEVLLLEVSGQREMEIGAEWVAAGKGSVSGNTAAAGGGFVNSPEESALPGLAAGQLPEGFSVGVFSQAIEIGGVNYNNLAALLSAVQKDRDVDIVSTPQILVIDNQEAKLNVGRNIPFQTATSTTDNETYNSFEYRDVGTTLTVTPHIDAGRRVQLDIGLELSQLESTTDFRPTTIKRTVDTSVRVEENRTVVIGGLIEDIEAVSEFKVPLLGDIPGLGRLFKFNRKSRQQTRIYVFLTPRILRHPSETGGQLDERI
jgi:general secretion pathway protein D